MKAEEIFRVKEVLISFGRVASYNEKGKDNIDEQTPEYLYHVHEEKIKKIEGDRYSLV